MNNNSKNFIKQNSPDCDFLQSEEWRKFQESVGRKTYGITGGDVDAFAIKHNLLLAGSYLYTPRWPVMQISNFKFEISNQIINPNEQILKHIQELITLAKDYEVGWIRIEPANKEILNTIKENINCKIIKAPHDMQPREILVMDITKSEEEILAGMKPKTRYNIKLAEKKGVKIFNFQFSIFNQFSNSNDQINNKKYINEFIRLTKVMAKRQGIQAHAENYYRKMLEIIPGEILKLYVAEYQNKVIAANLVAFFGNTCTYLHGASDDEYRNVMAPFLLQWQQIRDAKAAGCEKYDFGGVKIQNKSGKSWEGVTRFKTGFAPYAKPTEFPGSWDIVISPGKYYLYKLIQKAKNFLKH